MQKEDKKLFDVIMLRPLAIFLLVVYHSFIIYSGGWKEPEKFVDVSAYGWIANISYSFMLELFVMMSGTVWGFQLYVLNRNIKFANLFTSKFKRLMLPSIFFSMIYFILFKDFHSVLSFIYELLNGVGHMWFLPMLFFCFLFEYLLIRLKISDVAKIVITFCLVMLSLKSFPLQLASTCYYLFFFNLGLLLAKKRNHFAVKYCNVRWIILFMTSYLFIFLFHQFIKSECVFDCENIFLKIGILALDKYIRLICALLGSVGVILLVNKGLKLHNNVPKFVVWLNSVCFGVYIPTIHAADTLL